MSVWFQAQIALRSKYFFWISYRTYISLSPVHLQGCPDGSYQDRVGQDTCNECPAGSFSAGASSNCTQCAPGSYQPEAGTARCLSCPLNSYTVNNGSSACQPCEDGWFTFEEGSSACTPCLPGYSRVGNTSECEKCTPGSYSAAGKGCLMHLRLSGVRFIAFFQYGAVTRTKYSFQLEEPHLCFAKC